MRRLLLSLVHELGTGRALENARREHDEIARDDGGHRRAGAAGSSRGRDRLTAVAVGEARVAPPDPRAESGAAYAAGACTGS